MNFLLTIDNENGPLKVSNVKDFSEKRIFLKDDPVEVNSSKMSLKSSHEDF